MFTRQKLLLALLYAADCPVGRTSFVKMAFLLSRESPEDLRENCYHFVPYKYGPFSFELYHEAEKLESSGYLRWADDAVAPTPGELNGRRIVASLPESARRSVEGIVREYARMPTDELLRSVYRRYPWYATRTERTDCLPDGFLREQPPAPICAYTIGYQGLSLDAFLDRLLRSGIAQIADVRAHAVSRRYGFAGRTLANAAERLGIGYVHLPELGIPSRERADLTVPGARQALFDRYEREMLPTSESSLERLVQLMAGAASALVCMEREPFECHRGRLADVVAKRTGWSRVDL